MKVYIVFENNSYPKMLGVFDTKQKAIDYICENENNFIHNLELGETTWHKEEPIVEEKVEVEEGFEVRKEIVKEAKARLKEKLEVYKHAIECYKEWRDTQDMVTNEEDAKLYLNFLNAWEKWREVSYAGYWADTEMDYCVNRGEEGIISFIMEELMDNLYFELTDEEYDYITN